MDDLIKLKDDMNYCLKRAQEIMDNVSDADITEDQLNEVKLLQEQARGYEHQIERLESVQSLRANVANEYAAATAPKARMVPPVQPNSSLTDDDGSYTFKRKIEIPRVSPRHHESYGSGPEGAEAAYRAGQWFLSEVGSTMPKLMGSRKVAQARQWVSDYAPETRNMSTLDSGSGGVLVPSEMVAAIIERREQYGVFERFTNRVPMGHESSWPRVTSDQMATYGSEGSAITATDPTFDDVSLHAKSLRALTRVNNVLFEESPIDIGEFLARDFGRQFAKRIDTAGFKGDGSAANGGITGVTTQFTNNTSLAGYYKPTACDNFADVTTSMLSTFIGKLPEYAHMGNPAFFTNRMGKELCFGRLQMAAGGVTKIETTQGTFDSYNGIPIVTAQIMDGTESDFSDGDVMFILADLSMASYMGITKEITIDTSAHRYFENNQTGVRAVMRNDINVFDIGTTTAGDEGSVIAFISD